MTQEYFFGDAKWVSAADCTQNTFSVLRGEFTVDQPNAKVELNVLGLGFFKCYINGVCINPDTFLPISSDYEASCDPVDEVISGHRIYVPSFDISAYVKKGNNVIAIHYGGGWYTFRCRNFGLPKAIYSVSVFENGGVKQYCSDENCLIGKSPVTDYEFDTHESHDYAAVTLNFDLDNAAMAWEKAVLMSALETEYCQTDCPTDALIATLSVKKVGKGEKGTVYDCGENTTGYPVLKLSAGEVNEITVLMSEELTADGKLDMTHSHKQCFKVIGDGTEREVQPEFTWFGFRYFEVIGNAEPIAVKVVHASVGVNSTFESDNETLNWIYKTFIHTMLCNMHTGHPSDCPHLERRGYTGDGQLTCHAALSVLDGKAFYEKWMQDIGDCQDVLTGHIQYTAPYLRSGGGPGGWGCAIVEVPYQLYRHYGEIEILTKYYPQMRRYIDYLEEHSEFGLVTSDKKGEWCLGDWCGPIVLYPEKNISKSNQQMLIPPAMVNTYFMVKSLEKMAEIARIIGKDEDIAEYLEKAAERKKVIEAAYLTVYDGNFVMNVQGANAYAVDIGIGNAMTYPAMINYYSKLGYYDTGIFATDILTRVLFEHGDDKLAVQLLTGEGKQGFEHWRQNGATTLHEYWDSNRSRSHSHPMFGAPVAYIFEYLLGIRQEIGTAGYKSLVIEPRAVSEFGYMSGSMKVPCGDVSVSYKKTEGQIGFDISIPDGVSAVFKYDGQEYALVEGANTFKFGI